MTSEKKCFLKNQVFFFFGKKRGKRYEPLPWFFLIKEGKAHERVFSFFINKKKKKKNDMRLAPLDGRYLVDPASSHMLVLRIKPCMSQYKRSCTVKLRMAHYNSYSLFDRAELRG